MIRPRSHAAFSLASYARLAWRPLLAITLLAAGLGHARAQGIVEPEVEKGQVKLESNHIFQNGFNGGLAGATREVHSGSYAHKGSPTSVRSKALSPSIARTTRATRP